MRRIFYIGILLISGVLGFPRSVMFGSISANGLLTSFYGIVVILLLVKERRTVRASAKLIWPLALLLGWDILSWVWYWPSKQGFNETVSLAVFLGLIALLAAPEKPGFRQPDVGRFLGWSTTLSAVVYGISVVFEGPGTDSVIVARGFALFALLGAAWCVAGWAQGSSKRLFYVLVLLLLIGLSLSRTAFAAGVVLLPLSKLRVIRKRDLVQVGSASIVAGIFLFLAVSNIPALANRLLGGSTVAEIAAGDMDLNTNGRNVVWAMVLDDYTLSPWVGRGAGSASDLLGSYPEFQHAHNEYLRFLHDYGVIGLALFLWGFGSLLRKCWVNRCPGAADTAQSMRMKVAAFLALAVILLTMTTDNTGAYVYVMGPLGMMIGTALRPGSRQAALAPARATV